MSLNGYGRVYSRSKDKNTVLCWTINRCTVCSRFLSKYGKLYCPRCIAIRKKELNLERSRRFRLRHPNYQVIKNHKLGISKTYRR